MTEWLLIAAITIFSCVDVAITYRRIQKYGIMIELNPTVRFLANKLGAARGVFIGIIPASMLFAGALGIFGWKTALGFYTGWKAMLFTIQMDSLGLEKEIDVKRA